MKNGTMFCDIARYSDKNYFDTHRQIWLYTPQETLELEAVEWFSAPNSRELREQCLTEQTKGTYVFVTCSYDGKDNRGILWAREVSRVELPNKKSSELMKTNQALLIESKERVTFRQADRSRKTEYRIELQERYRRMILWESILELMVSVERQM